MKKIYAGFTALLAIQSILSFICGPYSCEWGNRVYFYSGILILAAAITKRMACYKKSCIQRTLCFNYSAIMVCRPSAGRV